LPGGGRRGEHVPAGRSEVAHTNEHLLFPKIEGSHHSLLFTCCRHETGPKQRIICLTTCFHRDLVFIKDHSASPAFRTAHWISGPRSESAERLVGYTNRETVIRTAGWISERWRRPVEPHKTDSR